MQHMGEIEPATDQHQNQEEPQHCCPARIAALGIMRLQLVHRLIMILHARGCRTI